MNKLLTLLLFLLCQACTSEPPQTLVVGSNQWLGYEPLYLARELDLYQDQSIKLVELTSATEVMNAFALGQLDVAALTLDEALKLMAYEPNLQVFLVMDISHGADKLIVNSSIRTLADLANKKVGVENTATGAFFISQILDIAKLQSSDIHIIPSTVDQHLAMMQTGELDAVVTFEPIASRLLEKGFYSLIDSRQIPGQIVDVLIAREQTIIEKKEMLKQLTEAHWKSLNYLKNHPQQAAAIIAPRIEMTVEQLLPSYRNVILPDQQLNAQMLQTEIGNLAGRLAEFMQTKGLLKKIPDTRNIASHVVIEVP